jgi:hypothetical protein
MAHCQPIPVSRAATAGLCIWLALQILIPLRFAAFPSEVRWAGDGHRFAWRMRMYSREGHGIFEVSDKTSGQVWRVEPTDYLTERQAAGMLTRPDMILQFAHYLRDIWRADGHADVAVHAHVEMSLNGRPFQALIRPEVDLAGVRLNQFRPDDWVTALHTPLPQPPRPSAVHVSAPSG